MSVHLCEATQVAYAVRSESLSRKFAGEMREGLPGNVSGFVMFSGPVGVASVCDR